jgi:thiamine pyrophosphate-dependent acetolactate synthase large subunit-like protein
MELFEKICELIGGGEPAVVSTKSELDNAIRRAQTSGNLSVIEIKIPRDDVSPQLVSIGREVARVRGWTTPAPSSVSNSNHR